MKEGLAQDDLKLEKILHEKEFSDINRNLTREQAYDTEMALQSDYWYTEVWQSGSIIIFFC